MQGWVWRDGLDWNGQGGAGQDGMGRGGGQGWVRHGRSLQRAVAQRWHGRVELGGLVRGMVWQYRASRAVNSRASLVMQGGHGGSGQGGAGRDGMCGAWQVMSGQGMACQVRSGQCGAGWRSTGWLNADMVGMGGAVRGMVRQDRASRAVRSRASWAMQGVASRVGHCGIGWSGQAGAGHGRVG